MDRRTTLRLDAGRPEDLQTAARMLREGKLVAFPTETVYGLGANALNKVAVAQIFAAKRRPRWDPLIVHIAGWEQLPEIATLGASLDERVQALSGRFWPGPLTLLLPRTPAVSDEVTAGRELVGVRVPAHPVAQALLRAAGVPVAAPSANVFGHTSPTTALHVLADLDGFIDAVLDGGPTQVGVESTVLDPGQVPMVLYRPGAVTAEQLTACTRVETRLFVPDETVAVEALPSPGVGLRHYAPRARLLLTAPTERELCRAIEQAAVPATGVLLPQDWRLPERSPQGLLVEPWARWEDAEGLAARLFACLRALDDRGAALIVCPLPEAGGLRDALRDRLEKAARTA